MEIDLIRFAVLVSVAVSAGIHDVARRSIPNWLTLTGLLAGVGLAALSGPAALGQHLLAAGLVLAMGLPLFATHALGGGDVKLLVAMAALLGLSSTPEMVFFTCAVGAAMAVTEAVRRGIILPLALDVRDVTVAFVTLGRRGASPGRPAVAAPSIPFGVAIGAGAVVTWLV